SLAQRREVALCERDFYRLGVVAGIECGTGGCTIGKRAGRHEIFADHVDRIELELDRDALHQSLQRVIHLWPAEAAVEPSRSLVSEHHTVAYRNVTDVVRAGEVAVHAIKRRRFGRADMRANVFDLVPRQRVHAAVGVHRSPERGNAVGGRYRRCEVLETILDPFYRAAGNARGDAHQHDVREKTLLDAEAAPGVGRRAQAQAVSRHFQGTRHDGVQAERSHEVGEHVISVFIRVIFGDETVGFDWRAGIAWIADRHRHAMRGLCKHALGVAVADRAFTRDVRTKTLMQEQSLWIERGEGIDDGRQRLVVDLNELQAIFGKVPVARQHNRDRLADITDALDGDRPAFDRRLHADDEAP